MIPYQVGLKFIHTPENMLLLRCPKNPSGLFHLVDTQPYLVTNDYCSINFHIQQKHEEMISVCMFTKAITESHMVMLDPAHKVLATLNMRVTPEGTSGHSLSVSYSADTEDLREQMLIVIAGLLFIQYDMLLSLTPNNSMIIISKLNGMQCFMHSSSRANEEPNLSAYRQTLFLSEVTP